MKFTAIDLAQWPRGSVFYYFSQMAPTGYSLTVDMDVTLLVRQLRQMGRKLFPTYLWLVTRCINRQPEFKVAYQNGQLGYYDTLTPLYATLHEDDHTISMMWTEYDEDYQTFYRRYMDNQAQYGRHHGILCQPQLPPANAYTVSCVPWISFRHFAVHVYENKPYFFPSIEAGKIVETDGHMRMPLSITCHHATTDGYHVARFLEELQAEMDLFSIGGDEDE
ncbi:MAG: CatA-like O-acetyltransferase [Aristaeellaceae bacterium]